MKLELRSQMKEKIFQIVYCSRNNIMGTPAEVRAQIEQILEASRRNNARVDVTGALFYNTVFFAQVLEGSFNQVQGVFERLQLDGRHSDLVVLQSGYAPGRDFADWSMAYAGGSADFALPFQDSPAHAPEVTAHSAHGEEVIDFLRDMVVKQETWALPERSSAVRAVSANAVLTH